MAAVTVGSRNTHYWAARYDPTQTGLPPVGLRQLFLFLFCWRLRSFRLVNVVDLRPGGLGYLGPAQIEWLEDDLKGKSASMPIVMYGRLTMSAHIRGQSKKKSSTLHTAKCRHT